MIKGGQVSTANKRTYPVMATKGFLSTFGNFRYWNSVLDLFSDALSTRPGQKVFFNIVKKDPLRGKDLDVKSEELEPENFLSFCGGQDERGKYGYTGVFEIAGEPRFDPRRTKSRFSGDPNAVLEPDFAIRIPIKPIKVFPDVVEEWRLLDVIDERVNIWQPRFRKFLRGAKSLTSLTPWEVKELMGVLEERIGDPVPGKELEVNPLRKGKIISIRDRLDQVEDGLPSKPPGGGLKDVKLDNVIVVEEGEKEFKYEKGLEAWWVESFDKEVEEFERLVGDGEITWFSNYVPAGSSGKALDGLALVRKENGNFRAIPVEMKKGKVKQVPGRRNVDQLYRYSVWAKKFLDRKVPGKIEDVRPVFLGREMASNAEKVAKKRLTREKYFYDPIMLEYEIEAAKVNLEWKKIS